MKNTIHYAFILDQSGSMEVHAKEVVSSFNEQVDMIRSINEKEQEFDLKITLCTFNDKIGFRYVAQSINKLNKLSQIDYQPHSCTALYDAMGITIQKMEKIIKPADKVFLAIFTDGLENASTDFSVSDIQKKLTQVNEKGWQVKFFCRDEDNLFYKQHLGVMDSQMMTVSLNEDGLKAMETEICYSLNEMMNTKKPQ
jgi:hypothetical protein